MGDRKRSRYMYVHVTGHLGQLSLPCLWDR